MPRRDGRGGRSGKTPGAAMVVVKKQVPEPPRPRERKRKGAATEPPPHPAAGTLRSHRLYPGSSGAHGVHGAPAVDPRQCRGGVVKESADG